MKQLAQGVLRYAALIAITAAATGIMAWASMRSDGVAEVGQQHVEPVAAVAMPKPLVAVEPLRAETCELTATFTGKIRPWEMYSLAFEVPGRVVELGSNGAGKPLDDGDRVEAGQVLARMDDRVFKAQKSEAVARLEEATTDMTRARNIRQRNSGAITETEFQAQLTELALARAGHETALKNLDDATLLSPVDATIARRYVNVGESVQGNEVAFELVQDDEMLLVVDVPESQIIELQNRMGVVAANQQDSAAHTVEEEDRHFRAYVTLEGHDRFGRKRPPIPAEVYRIAQVADSRTGLFEVEIRVPNQDRSLRAGMVATAQIVSDRVRAYRIPETAVLFRAEEAYVFAVRQRQVPLEVMFWETSSATVHQVDRVNLQRWIDQGEYVYVPEDEHPFEKIVVRGQQRLADGQYVKVISAAGENDKSDLPPLPEATAQQKRDDLNREVISPES